MMDAPAVSKHIVVVEDDESYSRLVRHMLEAAGFRVTTARDFVTALPVIEGSQHVDVLVADINMPPGSPHGLAIGLMAESKRQGLKIIYMTGAADPAQIARFAPNALVLSKPFTSQQLLAIVTTALGDG